MATILERLEAVWNSGVSAWCRRQVKAHEAGVVLALSIGTALTLWSQWASRGIEWAHGRVAAVAARAARAASMPSASASSTSDAFAQIGQSGDAFGGGNALFAALAGGLVFWAGYLQAKALKEARAAYAHQQFESTFFELLKLSRELLERFETIATRVGVATFGRDTAGAATLDYFAKTIVQDVERESADEREGVELARRLVGEFKHQYYDNHLSAFGPYFRVLYQTFKLVARSTLSPRQKAQFANIARGQISEGAVFLLALNGMTHEGHEFIRYIEEFGLLKHMHQGYRRRYSSELKVAYHDRAFFGSNDRANEPPFTKPKQARDFFLREDELNVHDAESPA